MIFSVLFILSENHNHAVNVNSVHNDIYWNLKQETVHIHILIDNYIQNLFKLLIYSKENIAQSYPFKLLFALKTWKSEYFPICPLHKIQLPNERQFDMNAHKCSTSLTSNTINKEFSHAQVIPPEASICRSSKDLMIWYLNTGHTVLSFI